MAGVKSMLNRFEQTDTMSTGKGPKPSVAVKPSVLQRFPQAKENDPASSSTSTTSSANGISKSNNPSPVKLPAFSGQIPALKPATANNSNNDKGRRVGVPKAFQNGTNNDNNNNHNDKNDDQTTPRKPSWARTTSPTPPTSTPSPSNETTKPPQTLPKFPAMSISSPPLTNSSSKPPAPPSKPDDDKNPDKSSNNKTAITPKNFNYKTDSIKSNSSNSSTSSSSSSSSSSSTSHQTSTSTSPTNGVFDFRSHLRKTSSASTGPPGKRVFSEASRDSSSSETTTSKTSVSVSSSNASTTSTDGEKRKSPSRVPPIPSTEDVVMRSKLDQDQEDVIVRKSDGKRFKKIHLPNGKPPPTPKKPAMPSNIDLKSIRQQYQKLKKGLDINIEDHQSAVPEDEEDDENVYAEGMTLQDSVSPPPTPKKPAQTSRESQRISLIPELLEEEELPIYDDTPIEDELYADGMSVLPEETKPKTSVSSDSQTATETEQEKKKRLKEEANAKKKEEKERKEKEKQAREEEKKRKKKEEEELRLRSKFNLTGQEKMVGEGVIKQDAKASGLNLKVRKGQIITIVRLDSNPPNKWLVKLDGQLGYVDSQNIEVNPNIIRQAMQNQGEEDDLDQPTYDDVPEESGHSPIVPLNDDYEDDGEIYELCE